MSIKESMLQARALIQQKRYEEARQILVGVSHPTAQKWLAKIDEITMDFGDPFAETETAPPPGFAPQYAANPAAGWPVGMAQVPQSQQQMASSKDYTTQLIIVIVLYWVLFFPGLIANIIWHEEGKRMEKLAGHALPGVGGLGLLRRWMWYVTLVSAVLIFLGLAWFVIGVLTY